MSPWWIRRSISAVVILASLKTLGHSRLGDDVDQRRLAALKPAMARLIAGPRSFGSVIGPSPCTSKPFARLA